MPASHQVNEASTKRVSSQGSMAWDRCAHSSVLCLPRQPTRTEDLDKQGSPGLYPTVLMLSSRCRKGGNLAGLPCIPLPSFLPNSHCFCLFPACLPALYISEQPQHHPEHLGKPLLGWPSCGWVGAEMQPDSCCDPTC